MTINHYLPTNDLLFKKLLASKGHENILLHFINDITGEQFQSVTINNTYHIDTYKTEKLNETNQLYTTIVDVSATTNTNVEVIIEMQVHNHAYFVERSLFYAMQTYTNAYDKIKRYTHLKPIYAINILNFDLFKQKQFCHQFDIIDTENNITLGNYNGQALFKLFYICLPNLTHDRILQLWQQFFTTGQVDKQAPQYLQDAQHIVAFQNLTTEEQQMITRADISRSDAEAILEYAQEQGEQKGLAKGILQTAKNMLLKNTDISFISEVTGLSIEEIKKITL